MHIGLIGGIGPAATDHYYRGLIGLHTDSGRALELTMAHADARDLVKNLANRDASKQAGIFLRLVKRLEAAGARAAAVTSMGGHFCIRELEAVSPLPIVNAIPEADAAIRKRQLKTVGIIGTRTVMETRLYGGIISADVVVPEGDQLDEVHKSYIEMATSARVTEEHRRIFFSAGRRLCQAQRAEAVLLGGTDLFLAFDGQECGFPTIDCAQVHVDAIFRRSAGDM